MSGQSLLLASRPAGLSLPATGTPRPVAGSSLKRITCRLAGLLAQSLRRGAWEPDT
jgi:hypothetical protein